MLGGAFYMIIKSLRAVAQIMLAKVIRLIYKYGKDNK
jgi:hypothetical protein